MQNRLLAKIFTTEHSLGDNVIPGWSASAKGDGRFLITRANGTTREVTLGESISAGDKEMSVTLDQKNNLKIGDHSIVIGDNIAEGYTAMKTSGKNRFKLANPEGKRTGALTVGMMVDIEGFPKGELSLSAYGHPIIGDQTIPLMKKESELSLLVFNNPDKGGYVAYFNKILPGEKNNRKNGIRGIFRPATKAGRPATFSEVIDGDERDYTTAVIWKSKSDRFVNVQMRPIASALEEAEIVEAIKDLNDVAHEEKANPDVVTQINWEIAALEEKKQAARDAYENKGFSITSGLDFVFPGSVPRYTTPEM